MPNNTENCIKELCYTKNNIYPSLEKLLAIIIKKAQENIQDYKNLAKFLLKKRYPHMTNLEINGYADFLNFHAEKIYNLVINGYKILQINKGDSESWGNKKIYAKFNLFIQRSDESTFAVIFQEAQALKILEKSSKAGLGKKDSIFAAKFFTVFKDINEFYLISINPKAVSKGNSLKYIHVMKNEVDFEKAKEAFINEEPSSCYSCKNKQICDFQNSLNLLKESKIQEENNVSLSWKMPKLNKEQCKVSLLRNGVFRVNAVPGSGKTTTMIELGKNLLLKGFMGDDILFLSFTNNGVKELKARFKIMALETFKNNPSMLNEALSVDFQSYNSLGNIIAQKNIEDKFSDIPKILNKVDSLIILQEIIEKNPDMQKFPASYKSPFSVRIPTGVCIYLLDKIEKTKRELVEYIAKGEEYEVEPSIKFYYEEYEKEKTKRNYIDYQDQIIMLMEYLTKHKLLYKAVIVDEFQDSNKAHISILKSMFKYLELLIVVGDDSQAIFSFNNVYPDNMINFDKSFENTEDYMITTNYRSCENIINASNIIISYSKNRTQKTINGVKNGGIIANIPINNKDDIIEFYSKNIASNKRTLILCGKNSDCEKLSAKFMNKNIPVSLEYSVFRDMLYALMDLFSAIILEEKKYVLFALSILKFKKIEDISEDEINIVFKKLIEIRNSSNSYFNLRTYYFQLLDIHIDFDPFDILDNKNIISIEKAFNYLRIYLESSLSERKSIISKTNEKNDCIPIRISTFHNAKGSEYDVVIIDGTSLRKTDKTAINDEDFRLLYVGFTRAISELYLLHNENLSKFKNALEFYAHESINKAKNISNKKAI